MATVERDDLGVDLSGAVEASRWYEDILDQAGSSEALTYLLAYYRSLKAGERSPNRPTNLHPKIAELIRGECLEQATMERRQRRTAA